MCLSDDDCWWANRDIRPTGSPTKNRWRKQKGLPSKTNLEEATAWPYRILQLLLLLLLSTAAEVV